MAITLTDGQIVHSMGTDTLFRIIGGAFTSSVVEGVFSLTDTASGTVYTFPVVNSVADLTVLISLELASRI